MNKTKISQRSVTILLLLVVAGLALAACVVPAAPAPAEPAEEPAAEEPAAEEPAAEEEVVTIEWWTVDSEEFSEQAQRAMVEAFEAEHPNIKVDMSIVPDFDTKMTTALGAGQGAPDVAFFWLAEWQPQALDLRPFIERDDFDIDMYFKGNFDSWSRLGDEIIGLPLGVGANFVMYNKDVFDEAGIDYPTVDWTTEDYIEMASQLADEEKKRWGGDRPRGAYRAIWMNHGAKPYSDDSTTVEGYLNGPESVAAYTWLWDLVNSNSTPTPAELEVLASEFTGPVELFLADRIGMATLNNGHMLTAVKEGKNFGIVPEPAGPGEDRHVHGWSLTSSIWEGTEHPDEAWTFLKWWAGPEGQRFLMENGQLFPSIPEVLHEYEDADQEYAQAFFDVLELEPTSDWLGKHPCYRGAVRRATQDIWDQIMLGEIERDEIQGALDALVPVAQEALDECVSRLGG